MKSFLRWIETEEFPSLSEPQHKKNEANESLAKVIENRIKSIILDIGPQGGKNQKGTEQEILTAIMDCAKKMSGGEQSNQAAQGQQQAGTGETSGGAPAAAAAPAGGMPAQDQQQPMSPVA